MPAAVLEVAGVLEKHRVGMEERVRSTDVTHVLVVRANIAEQDHHLEALVLHIMVPREHVAFRSQASEISHRHRALDDGRPAEVEPSCLQELSAAAEPDQLGRILEGVVRDECTLVRPPVLLLEVVPFAASTTGDLASEAVDEGLELASHQVQLVRLDETAHLDDAVAIEVARPPFSTCPTRAPLFIAAPEAMIPLTDRVQHVHTHGVRIQSSASIPIADRMAGAVGQEAGRRLGVTACDGVV